jgi:hypothetical protein
MLCIFLLISTLVFWSHNIVTLAALFTTKSSQYPCKSKTPSTVQAMMYGKQTKVACEEIESLFWGIETA